MSALELDAIVRASAGFLPRPEALAVVEGLKEKGLIGQGYPEVLARGSNKSRLSLDPASRDQTSPALAAKKQSPSDSNSSSPSDCGPEDLSLPFGSHILNTNLLDTTNARIRAHAYIDIGGSRDPKVYPDAKIPKLQGHALVRGPGRKLRTSTTLRKLNIYQKPMIKRFSVEPVDSFSLRWMHFVTEIQWAHRWGCIDTITFHLQRRILERLYEEGTEPPQLFGPAWALEQEIEAKKLYYDHYNRQPEYWRAVVDWFFDDPFWCDKILSTKILRRHYPRFVLAERQTTSLRSRLSRLKIIGE